MPNRMSKVAKETVRRIKSEPAFAKQMSENVLHVFFEEVLYVQTVFSEAWGDGVER